MFNLPDGRTARYILPTYLENTGSDHSGSYMDETIEVDSKIRDIGNENHECGLCIFLSIFFFFEERFHSKFKWHSLIPFQA